MNNQQKKCNCGNTCDKRAKQCKLCRLQEQHDIKRKNIQNNYPYKKGGSQHKDVNGESHYTRNKKTYLERQKEYTKTKRELITDYKKTLRCVDCGNSDYRVLDFDHLGDKKFNISSAAQRGYSWKAIKNEILKCDPVCSNCHRIRTFNRKKGLLV